MKKELHVFLLGSLCYSLGSSFIPVAAIKHPDQKHLGRGKGLLDFQVTVPSLRASEGRNSGSYWHHSHNSQ